MSDAVLVSGYLTRTIADAEKLEGVDFSEAVMPPKTQAALCLREDVKGVNSKTKVDTRESLMCPD